MEKRISYPIEIFIKYRDVNNDLPDELMEFIDKNKKIQKTKKDPKDLKDSKDPNIWRKSDPRAQRPSRTSRHAGFASTALAVAGYRVVPTRRRIW